MSQTKSRKTKLTRGKRAPIDFKFSLKTCKMEQMRNLRGGNKLKSLNRGLALN